MSLDIDVYSRTLNNKINHIHERALRTVYSDYKSSFNELLNKDDALQKIVQNLAIEIYKYLHSLFWKILGENLKVNKIVPHDLRMRNELFSRYPKVVGYDTEAKTFVSPKSWALIPRNMKDSSSLAPWPISDILNLF